MAPYCILLSVSGIARRAARAHASSMRILDVSQIKSCMFNSRARAWIMHADSRCQLGQIMLVLDIRQPRARVYHACGFYTGCLLDPIMHILDEGKYVQLYMYCTTGRILLDLVVAAWLVHVADHGWLARMHICSHVRTTLLDHSA